MKIFYEFLSITFIFYLSILLFYFVDRNDMLNYGVFPWDSVVGKHLADEFYGGNFTNLNAVDPFGLRVVFPFAYAHISKIFNVSLIQSA